MPFALYAYIYFRVKAYRELKLVRALDEDTRVFSGTVFTYTYVPLEKYTYLRINSCLSEAVIISKKCNYVYPCCN